MPDIAAAVSGVTLAFPDNALNLKALSLTPAGPDPGYRLDVYTHDATRLTRRSGSTGRSGSTDSTGKATRTRSGSAPRAEAGWTSAPLPSTSTM
jgi:hypothetical protein